MVKKVTALKARQNLGELLEEVYHKGDQFIIERAGHPMAAVVPLSQLESREKRRRRFFETIDEIRKRNAGVRPEIIEREVAEAVRAVRAQHPRKKT